MPLSSSPPTRRGSLALLPLLALACSSCIAGETRVIYHDHTPSASTPSAVEWIAGPDRPLRAAVLASPMSLTSADGTALVLDTLKVHGAVDGPLALTEFHMNFINAEARTIEGRFELILPPGASLNRFAMRVGNRWQEAEIVERQRARQIYEVILHQGLDPALLEREAGNRFRARVFPIGPNETKELIVSYTQELVDGRYAIPLRGLPKLARLEVEVERSTGHERFVRAFDRYLAKEDLVVPLADSGEPQFAQGNAAFAQGDFALARVVPVPLAPGVEALVEALEDLTLLFDTSASRGAEFATKVNNLEQFCSSLRASHPGDLRFRLVAFDQTSETIYAGPLSGLEARHFDQLYRRGALGATDLEGALAQLEPTSRLILASDGITTAGETAEIAQLAASLAAKGIVRIDALLDGSTRDQPLLTELVNEALELAGQVLELAELGPAAAAARVLAPTLDPVEITVEGARWSAPREVRGLQPGDAVLVYAEVDPSASLHLELNHLELNHLERGKTTSVREDLTLTPSPIHHALLERSAITRRVDELVALLENQALAEPDLAVSTHHQIVRLATRHRVVTPYTAMLVLEDAVAYARFGLREDGLAPILTLGAQGPVLRHDRPGFPLHEVENPQSNGSSELDSRDLPTHFVPDEMPRAEQPQPEPQPRVEDIAAPTKQLPDGGEMALGDTLAPSEIWDDEESPRESRIRAIEQSFRAARREARENNARERRARANAPRDPTVRVMRDRLPAGFERDAIQRALERVDAAVARCYDDSLGRDGWWSGYEQIDLDLDARAQLIELRLTGVKGHPHFDSCLRRAAAGFGFPLADHGESTTLLRRYQFKPGTPVEGGPLALGAHASTRAAIHGRYATVLDHLAAGSLDEGMEFVEVWLELLPGDPLAHLSLGQLLAARGDNERAARAYGGLIDLHPSRAELRRFAGNLLESLPSSAETLALARDSYARAVEARPDQPSSYRMLAMAQARMGQLEAAIETLGRALELNLPDERYLGVRAILLLDLELLAGVWSARAPNERKAILRHTIALGARIDTSPSTRFVLTWETDASDVDLHVHDRKGNHADYESPVLRSGGRLLADVTTGFGPEAFIIPEPDAYPYDLSVDYYSRGSMGHGMGQVHILTHDGSGQLLFESRPFVVMREHSQLPLGTVER